jgi:hypothetical protein
LVFTCSPSFVALSLVSVLLFTFAAETMDIDLDSSLVAA